MRELERRPKVDSLSWAYVEKRRIKIGSQIWTSQLADAPWVVTAALMKESINRLQLLACIRMIRNMRMLTIRDLMEERDVKQKSPAKKAQASISSHE